MSPTSYLSQPIVLPLTANSHRSLPIVSVGIPIIGRWATSCRVRRLGTSLAPARSKRPIRFMRSRTVLGHEHEMVLLRRPERTRPVSFDDLTITASIQCMFGAIRYLEGARTIRLGRLELWLASASPTGSAHNDLSSFQIDRVPSQSRDLARSKPCGDSGVGRGNSMTGVSAMDDLGGVTFEVIRALASRRWPLVLLSKQVPLRATHRPWAGCPLAGEFN
jgi:hypothetical protein